MNETQKYVLFKTNCNHYVYDPRLRQILLCHPQLYRLLKDALNNDSLKNKKECEKISGNKKGKSSQTTYYQRKYQDLLQVGFFKGVNMDAKLSGRVTPEGVKKSLANLSQVTFEVTDRCNLACAYCGYGDLYSDYDKRDGGDLSLNRAITLMQYLNKFWTSPENLSHLHRVRVSFYGGEPLLNMKFVREMVVYVKNLNNQRNLIFDFSMTTNGILLEKYMTFLEENDFDLLISLDGDRESNDYRLLKNGTPAFNIIFDNSKKLQSTFPEYFKKRVNFSTVFHNKNSIQRIHKFFNENFDKVPIVGELNPYGVKPTKKKEFMDTYSNINQSLYLADNTSDIEKDFFVNLPNIKSVAIFLDKYSSCSYRDYYEMVFPSEKMGLIPTGTCFPFAKRLFLTVNGKILPCERVSHDHSFGNVDENGVQMDFDYISKKYNTLYDSVSKLCRNCYRNETCQQCVLNITDAGANPTCRSFLDYQKFSEYLSAHMSYIELHPEIYARVMDEVAIE